MIRANINKEYPQHLSGSTNTDTSLFVADYSNKTKYTSPKIGTKLLTVPPMDIDYFTLNNSAGLSITGIAFDNTSFMRKKNPLPQCECVVFPETSTAESWILFAELKYCQECSNKQDLNKARRQLFKTQYYYKSKGVFSKTNTCYLLASLPLQAEPFKHLVLTQNYLLNMKERHNVVIRFQNSADILNDKLINMALSTNN